MNISASSNESLQRAILEALAYSDIFEHPLRLEELHRYLPVRTDVAEVPPALDSLQGQVEKQDEFYFLTGRVDIVEIRRQREARSRELLPHSIRYGRMLGSLPFVRMVALTGSLAVLNVSKAADFDYMLVTTKGRVWTARLFAVALNRLANLFGYRLCPNLIVSETALEWPLHDLYSARELVQMIPITGMDVYYRLMKANEWARDLLPNSSHDSAKRPFGDSREERATKVATTSKSFFEFLLRSKLGDRFENWEMTRKINRFSKQPGFGEETIFTAELCQGNFHHHRKWTRDVFEEKLAALAAVPGGELLKYPSPRTATQAHIV
ncbi:MAG TPA: hypothetical protein VMJ90_06445 [Anaerolineales bacterium]|nr:hypothetical protein [Anaerolineales bacterium]